MSRPGYVFIVGSPRTGTSLLRDVLDTSKEVAICGETKFFGSPKTGAIVLKNLFGGSSPFAPNQTTQNFRQILSEVGDIKTDEGAKKIVDHIFSSELHVWRGVCQGTNKESFLQQVLASDRTDQALFDIILHSYAKGKPIRGEKTPAHVHFLPTLYEWYPNTKFIHTFRDPRAIYISQRKKNHRVINWRHRLIGKSDVLNDMFMAMHVIITWRRVAELHRQYQKQFPNDDYLLCRYEDLVSQPEPQIRRICTFLDIEFSEAMLQQKVFNSSLIPRGQVHGFDSSAIDRWRQHISPVINKWFVMSTKKYLLDLGYTP
ncbi:MAG: sulfotransferase [Anaerolineae bacterium]|nr:sulfotransferase [Anaerolineae bacterium]